MVAIFYFVYGNISDIHAFGHLQCYHKSKVNKCAIKVEWKVAASQFFNYKCIPIQATSLQKYNFLGAMSVKCQGIKNNSGGVVCKGYTGTLAGTATEF